MVGWWAAALEQSQYWVKPREKKGKKSTWLDVNQVATAKTMTKGKRKRLFLCLWNKQWRVFSNLGTGGRQATLCPMFAHPIQGPFVRVVTTKQAFEWRIERRSITDNCFMPLSDRVISGVLCMAKVMTLLHSRVDKGKITCLSTTSIHPDWRGLGEPGPRAHPDSRPALYG